MSDSETFLLDDFHSLFDNSADEDEADSISDDRGEDEHDGTHLYGQCCLDTAFQAGFLAGQRQIVAMDNRELFLLRAGFQEGRDRTIKCFKWVLVGLVIAMGAWLVKSCWRFCQ